MSATAELSLPFGLSLPTICCPVCGTTLLSLPEEIEASCPHLLYVHIEDFCYLAPIVEAFLEELPQEDRYRTCWSKWLPERLAEPSMLHIVLNESGMACGPIFTQLLIGFDLAVGLSDED
jgi:hypothetical protein